MLSAVLATLETCGPVSTGGMLAPRMVDGGSPLDLAMARFAAGDEGALATPAGVHLPVAPVRGSPLGRGSDPIFLDHLRASPGRAEVLSRGPEVDRPNQSPTGTPKTTAEDLLARAELTQAVDAALTTQGAVKLRAHRAYWALRALLGHRVERNGL